MSAPSLQDYVVEVGADLGAVVEFLLLEDALLQVLQLFNRLLDLLLHALDRFYY